MAVATYILPRFQAIDDFGRPMVGAKLYTYQNKTTTPAPTYRDAQQSAANTNPIVLDASGSAVVYLLVEQIYTFVLKNRDDAIVWSQDDVIGGASAADVAALSESGGSSLVGFLQSGAGAEPRTVQEKLRDIVTGGDFPSAQAAADASLDRIFFVPAGGTVYVDVPEKRTSLPAAIQAISQWSVPSTSSVVIRIAAGSYSSEETTVMDNSFGENITITGPEVVQTTSITGLSGTAGTRGNYSVTLAVQSNGGMVVGDWVGIEGTVGTGRHKVLRGFYQITSVSPGTITLRVRLWDALFPAMTVTGGSVYLVPAVIKVSNTDAFVLRSSAVTLQNIGFVGNMWDYWNEADILGTEKGTHGIYVSSNTIIDGTGAAGGANPFALNGSGLSANRVYVADFDQQGICVSNGGGIYGRNLWASSCGRRGFYAASSASIEARFSGASANYRDGAIADYGGCFNTSGFEGNGNRLNGAFAINGGSVVAVNSSFEGNLGYGIEARAGSYVTIDGASSCKYNGAGGCHFEYGATGSIVAADISENASDGVTAIYGSAVRATNANISNNARYGINALYSAVRHTGAVLSGNGTAPIFNTASMVTDGTNYEPMANPTSVYSIEAVNTAKNHRVTHSVSGIGDWIVAFDGTAQYQFKGNALNPVSDNNKTIGTSASRWSDGYIARVRTGPGTAVNTSGTGSPEGALAAAVGSTYGRLDGAGGSSFYVKESGTGNTGWIAK
ncbi:right-handed parallel beta-helix repeat-containing protein [Achromobacter marplatensis]|uniref:right-handed parallel beta-helix repeat-containing protein n=1 Tax=Achromobacter marplatensis TaxID=470868 RepID=UPI0028E808C6|nr:right-handed parallel beta-helix repeat-containing protein [Achromobacter marplatensis]